MKRDFNDLAIIRIYPNPAENTVRVDFNSTSNEKINIVIRDVIGRDVKLLKVDAIDGVQSLEIDLSELSSGTYFLTLENSKSRVVEILLKE